MPRGPSTFLMMSCTGRCHSAFDQSTGGRCCARSNDFDARIRILARGVRRKHRPDLILLAVQPRDEQHLHRAAAVPVALLVIRADAANAGAKPLHVHRGVARVAESRDAHLILGGRRTAGRADLAVGPRLLRQPVNGVVAVGLRAEDVVVAFREEVSPLVLHDIGVTALDRRQRRAHVGWDPVVDIPEVEVVRGADPDRGHFPRRVLRAVDVGRQPHAVGHRHHHLALDDRNRLELRFGVDPPLLLDGAQRSLLRVCQGYGGADGERRGEDEMADAVRLHGAMIPPKGRERSRTAGSDVLSVRQMMWAFIVPAFMIQHRRHCRYRPRRRSARCVSSIKSPARSVA